MAMVVNLFFVVVVIQLASRKTGYIFRGLADVSQRLYRSSGISWSRRLPDICEDVFVQRSYRYLRRYLFNLC